MRPYSPALCFLEDMFSSGGLVKGVHSFSSHQDCSLEEHHVQAFVVLRTEGRVHDNCVELVFPLVTNITDIGVDDINIADFKI